MMQADVRSGGTVVRWERGDLIAALAIMVGAGLLRALFYTGMFYSDDLTYTDGASKLLHGDWSLRTYIGSLRYGVDLPVAFFMWLAGENEIAANLWSFLCSVGEVGLVFVAARLFWGRREAVAAAIVMAFLPLHIIYGGRLMADAPLGFFVTLSFVLFFLGENMRTMGWYLGAGLACGFSFWIKQSVMILFCVAFVGYALAYRLWRWQWMWMGLGVLVAAGSNCLFFWAISGDPLYLLTVMRKGMVAYQSWDFVETGAGFYFWRLLVDLRDTWLLGPLAVAGCVLYVLRKASGRPERGTALAVFWAVALVGIFSFAPVSFNPVKLVMKQPNYMLIFVAPLCLLAGYLLAGLPRAALLIVGGGYALGAMALAGLAQQDIKVFTANSRAAVDYAVSNRPVPVYGMTGAFRAGVARFVFAGRTGDEQPVKLLSSLPDGPVAPAADAGGERLAFAIVDLQTAHWGGNPIKGLDDVPGCWRKVSRLEPAETGGAGKAIVTLLAGAFSIVPGSLGSMLQNRIAALVEPRPAYVYEIPAGCVYALKGGKSG
jgi:hypothetical protein